MQLKQIVKQERVKGRGVGEKKKKKKTRKEIACCDEEKDSQTKQANGKGKIT